MSLDSTYDKHNMELQESLSGSMSIDGSLIEKESPPQFVTQRNRAIVQDSVDVLAELRSFQTSMMAYMKELFEKQNEKLSRVIEDYDHMKTSIQFISEKYDHLNSQADELRGHVSVLESKIKHMETREKQIVELENKLEMFELASRQCNIEIVNLPEKRNENLMGVLENMAAVFKQQITKQDIVAVHRVGQMNPQSTRPKNVVVKFTSRITRDNFLASARLTKGITTDQLQIGGVKHKIYLNEHLTMNRKILFREAREAAKKHGYKFTWIKHGTILVRKNETSSVFAVRSRDDLAKFTPETDISK